MISIEERSLNDELQRMLRGQKSNGVIAKFSDHTGQYRSSGSVTVPGEKSPGGEQPGAGEESAKMNGPEEVGGISQAKDQRRQESRTFGLDNLINNRLNCSTYTIVQPF